MVRVDLQRLALHSALSADTIDNRGFWYAEMINVVRE
jgi:hypothetical protein